MGSACVLTAAAAKAWTAPLALARAPPRVLRDVIRRDRRLNSIFHSCNLPRDMFFGKKGEQQDDFFVVYVHAAARGGK